MFNIHKHIKAAHADEIWTCKWNRSKDVIVSGSVDGYVNCWKVTRDASIGIGTKSNNDDDAASEMKDSNTSDTPIYSWNASPLGIVAVDSIKNLVISSGMDSNLTVWNLDDGKCDKIIFCGSVETWCSKISPSGEHVATSGQSGNINIWDIQSGKLAQTLETSTAKFTMSLAYSPDGKYVACGYVDGGVTIFDTSTAHRIHTLDLAHMMNIRSVSFSPDSKTLLTASDDMHINIYDISSGKSTGTVSGHGSWVLCVSYSPTGKHFASSSSDGAVKVWDSSTHECLATLKDHKGQVWCLDWNSSGTQFASVSEDRSIIVYNCLSEK